MKLNKGCSTLFQSNQVGLYRISQEEVKELKGKSCTFWDQYEQYCYEMSGQYLVMLENLKEMNK